jgi:hypothetical protein
MVQNAANGCFKSHMMWFSISAPAVSRGTREASGAAPKGKVCFFGGTATATADPKDGGGAETRRVSKRKQKTAAPPGAARPSRGRQTKQCPREKGRNGEPQKRYGPRLPHTDMECSPVLTTAEAR